MDSAPKLLQTRIRILPGILTCKTNLIFFFFFLNNLKQKQICFYTLIVRTSLNFFFYHIRFPKTMLAPGSCSKSEIFMDPKKLSGSDQIRFRRYPGWTLLTKIITFCAPDLFHGIISPHLK